MKHPHLWHLCLASIDAMLRQKSPPPKTTGTDHFLNEVGDVVLIENDKQLLEVSGATRGN